MNKTKFTSLAAGILLAMALTFSCSSSTDNPDLPPVNNSGSDDSSSSEISLPSSSGVFDGQSSSSVEEQSSNSTVELNYNYCIFSGEGVCLDGPVSVCPPGGALSNECPYRSSSSVTSSSSTVSSSSVAFSSSTVSSSSVASSSSAVSSSSRVSSSSAQSSSSGQSSSSVGVPSSSSDLLPRNCDGGYNTQIEFCFEDNKVYPLCGTGVSGLYDPALIGCCKNTKFTLATQACCGNNAIYNKATQSCINGIVPAKCGSSEYDTYTHFCSDNEVYQKCNGLTFTAATQACCSNNAIYNKATHGCINGMVLLKCGTEYCDTEVEHYGKMKKQFFDEREKPGKKYVYVKIGTQTWMAENLNYAVSGSKCGNVNSLGSSLSNSNTSTCDTYGRLYNWATAMALPSSCNSNSCSGQIQSKHQGICPSGWHIPSRAEWNTLSNYVQINSDCSGCDARLLKAKSGWNSNGNGTDDYGFSALPGGDGYSDGVFYDVGNYGYWWSASEYEDYSNYAYGRYMDYDNEYAYWGSLSKSVLFSIRCLQD